MSFILRAAFWLTVLAFLLPSAEDASGTQTASAGGLVPAAYGEASPIGNAEMGAGEAMTLAARSAQDVMGFCDRNPDVCDRGHAIVGHVMKQTVHYGGQALVWLTDKAKEQQRGTTETSSPTVAIRPVAAPAHLAGA